MDVLLVEPSRVGLSILGKMLERRGDVVHPFQDGVEALAFLRKTPGVDVIITSFETKTICGLELCWEARVLSESRGPIHVIVMSADREDAKLIEALDSGADDFFHKPPIEAELNARLRAAERMVRTQKEILRMAQTDPLTGAYNRRFFFDRMRAEIEEGGGRPLSLVMLDIDHFKSVNDRYGHDVGDLVICQVAGQFARREGVFGRIGGEEFAWLLPDCDEAQAVEKAEAVRRIIERTPVSSDQGRFSVTSSFGVAALGPGMGLAELSKRADMALYEAKRSGRNCIGLGSQVEPRRLSA
ncbi:MAG: diguanylate cyclase response regulator [Hyphomicrobiales bacterium]|nr:MAG: diguanylate cyclase response regulator [Hyphomicrobiales bacterium]